MTKYIGITALKKELEEIIELVLAGEDVIITRYNKPVAKLIPYVEEKPITFGVLKGQIHVAEDPEIIHDFESESDRF